MKNKTFNNGISSHSKTADCTIYYIERQNYLNATKSTTLAFLDLGLSGFGFGVGFFGDGVAGGATGGGVDGALEAMISKSVWPKNKEFRISITFSQ